jgi:tRNA-specific 2-thiouridylase
MARVFVGLSGGVDSAVSAALLQKAGHDVTGCFVRIWRPEFLECTWREDRLDALRVAAHLGISFREVDLSGAYEERVIRDMLATYARGETPNPDTLCNSRIKFDAFLDWALGEGAERLATGHYARITHDPVELYRGSDASKDQSYFLSLVPVSALSRVLLPVGSLRKTEVRAMAQELGLPVARKRDSQGLCFVGDVTLPEFLSRYIPQRPSSVVDSRNRTIGEHRGSAFYTIGQRHGFSVADTRAYYVTRIDASKNLLVVSPDHQDAQTQRATLHSLNWFTEPVVGGSYVFSPRYHAEVRGSIESADRDRAALLFESPIIAAPGQTCTIYDDERVVGAGTIAVHSS